MFLWYYYIILNGGVILKKLLSFMLVLSLSLTFLMISIENNAYNKGYYLRAYNEYDIEKETGRIMYELEEITIHIIDYLKGKGGDELLNPYFNDREVLHMRDVQNLFRYERIIKYIFGILSIIIMWYLGYKKEYIRFGKTITYGLFINHIVLIILALFIMTDFNKYFTIFHHIFFNNDLWLLNPETDLMIQMLPEEFFVGMAKNIGLSFFKYLSILQITGIYYIKKGRRGEWKE